MVGHLVFKGSKNSDFIMKSYFYKSLMTEERGFKTKKTQPPTSEKKMRLFFSFLIESDAMVYPDTLIFLYLIFGAFLGSG